MSQEKSVLDRYPNHAANIGIEVHVQLSTKSKIFCSCSNEYTQEPNRNICPVCSGYPGVLPVLNKEVVNFAILLGLATNCKINQSCSFARKHYFYPDLPKNYQVTQSDRPICSEGYIPIRKEDGSIKHIRLIRIHMEEDAGKNLHAGNESFVDLNRTGTPLLEIVSYPDIESSYEAKAYLKMLHTIVRYLNIGTGNMEEGAFRADTNVSVRKKTDQKLGTRCELKNINSFKFICDAIDYEIERQIQVLETEKKVEQQTLYWDTKEKKTVSMRSKEEAADYRYFQEPDLPILEINNEWIARVKSNLPELPFDKFNRLVSEKGLSAYEAEILIEDPALAQFFDRASEHSLSKHLVNLILRDLMAYLKEHKIPFAEIKMTPKQLAELANLLETGKINSHAGQIVFKECVETGKSPLVIVKEKGLEQIGSEKELEDLVLLIIKENPKEVEQYRAGKENLLGFFMGTAMKRTQGKGNPQMITKLFKQHLSG